MKKYKSKMNAVMNHEESWESKGNSGSCRKCGNFVKNGEEYYLVVILGSDFKKQFPKEGNFITHKSCFDSLAKDNKGDEYKTIELILSKKRKRPQNRKPVDEKMVERFKKVVVPEMRLRIQDETANRIYFKPPYRGRIGNFYLDKRHLKIKYNGRGFNQLFDGMILSEMISRIDERLHEKEEGFRVKKVLNRAIEETNKIMRR